MKVRFGDLKFRNGRTMEEAARYCAMAGDCEGCEYRTEIECLLLPDYHTLRQKVSNIMNYEMEIPQADHYGQWIHEQHEFGFDGWCCSECGTRNYNLPHGVTNPYKFPSSHYCPQCGAKMDGTEE